MFGPLSGLVASISIAAREERQNHPFSSAILHRAVVEAIWFAKRRLSMTGAKTKYFP